MYYYYVYITMIVYFLTDVMKWLRGKWNQLMKLVIPVWSSIGQDFCVPSMHNRELKFGYQHFLLCQKSFLKVSSKWLLKNKSDNGKLLLGKTYSGERFRAILALLFTMSFSIWESVLSHKNPCFPCNIAITNFLVSNTCEIRFHDVIGQSTVHYVFLLKKFKTWLTYMAKWVCFGPLFFKIICRIQLHDKKNLTWIWHSLTVVIKFY